MVIIMSIDEERVFQYLLELVKKYGLNKEELEDLSNCEKLNNNN